MINLNAIHNVSGTSLVSLGDGSNSTTQQVSNNHSHEAWIPGLETLKILNNLPTGKDRKCYVMPGIYSDEKQNDPLCDVVRKFMGDAVAAQRLAKFADLPQNEDGLKLLVSSGNLRQAIDMSGKMLSVLGHGVGKARQPSVLSIESLKLWTFRFSCLMRLELYTNAANEMDLFGNLDTPDLYYAYHPETYGVRSGSLVPFTMRLIHAQLPLFIGHIEWSLARLEKMQSCVKTMIQNVKSGFAEDGSVPVPGFSPDRTNSAVELWNRRLAKVTRALATTLMKSKDYQLCIDTLAQQCNDPSPAQNQDLLLLGRVALQVGDVGQSMEAFKMYSAIPGNANNEENTLNWAYISMCTGDMNKACELFKDRMLERPDTSVTLRNNLAVMHMYNGNLTEALKILEDVLLKNPQDTLHEGLVLNLCTLYELSHGRSSQMKINLLHHVNQFCGDSFSVSSLKLL